MPAQFPRPLLATHGGTFHLDDAFAYAVLRLALGLGEPGGDHAPMVLVLDPRRGEVRRLLGLPAPEAIATAVVAALDARKAGA